MNRSLRILMISPQFTPIVGGYERAAERLSVELVRQGHSVTVVAERRDRSWPRSERQREYLLQRLWCVYRPGCHVLSSLLSLAAFLLTSGRRYDVFHIHQYGYHAGLTILVGKLLRKPTVLKITNTESKGIGEALSALGTRGIPLAHIHRMVDACITTSSDALKEAVRFGIDEHKIIVVPNGVNVCEFTRCSDVERQRLKKRLGLGRSLTVLYCGRLAPEKNPDGLIEAWRIVHRNIEDAELVLVGDGPLMSSVVARVAAAELGGSVRIMGAQADVLSWYRVADLFVLPSHHEGLSNSLVEAMSCSLPVISTRVSGSVDMFSGSDIGELVDVGSYEKLSVAIVRMLADPDRRGACGARARICAENELAIEMVAKVTASLYKRLLEEVPGRP